MLRCHRSPPSRGQASKRLAQDAIINFPLLGLQSWLNKKRKYKGQMFGCLTEGQKVIIEVARNGQGSILTPTQTTMSSSSLVAFDSKQKLPLDLLASGS